MYVESEGGREGWQRGMERGREGGKNCGRQGQNLCNSKSKENFEAMIYSVVAFSLTATTALWWPNVSVHKHEHAYLTESIIRESS